MRRLARFICVISMATTPLYLALEPAMAAASSDNNADDSLGDIVVTAQRRSENLEKTPVAVTAISADELARANIVTEQDLRFVAPGLEIRAGNPSSTINFTLRGQSQDLTSDTRPGVLPYFNEIPVAGQGVASAIYDLESVQVLKGPQGTLFGRSATGGAVLYSTAKPSDEFGGYVDIGGGNYSEKNAEGAVNIPLIKDSLSMRVAGYWFNRDGFQYNLYNNSRVGDNAKDAVRISFKGNIGERFEDVLVIDHFHSNGQNVESPDSGLMPLSSVPGTAPFIPAQLLWGGNATPAAAAAGIATLQAFTGESLATATANYNAYFAQPGHPATGLTTFTSQQLARGPYVVDYNTGNLFRIVTDTQTNTATFKINDNTTLKNIFGYIRVNTDNAYDVDHTPYGIQNYDFGPEQDFRRQYTDEMQISGNILSNKLSYVAGIFVSDELTRYYVHLDFFDITTFPAPAPEGVYSHNLTSRTLAEYAQSNYELNDSGLAVTTGVRYTEERVGKVTLGDDSASVLCGVPGYSCNKSSKFDNISWTFGLQDQITNNLLTYAVTRRAYKSGGYNGDVTPKVGLGSVDGGDAYGQEQLTDVEVGVKYQGTLARLPVRANLAVYHDWDEDGQRSAYVLNPAPGTLNVNVPAARTSGVELDAQIKPFSMLTVGASFNYTDAAYTNGVTSVLGEPYVFSHITDTPRITDSLFTDLTLPLPSSMDVVLHGDVYNQSKDYTSGNAANYVGTVIPTYTITDFRVILESPVQGWSLTANLKNAFNRIYYVGGFGLGEIYQVNSLTPGNPRMVTVDLKYKF